MSRLKLSGAARVAEQASVDPAQARSSAVEQSTRFGGRKLGQQVNPTRDMKSSPRRNESRRFAVNRGQAAARHRVCASRLLAGSMRGGFQATGDAGGSQESAGETFVAEPQVGGNHHGGHPKLRIRRELRH